MNLPPDDANLFYEMMFPLQLHLGRRAGILKDCPDVAAYKKLPFETMLKARDALVEHPDWIDRYCEENPDGRTPDEIAILRGWKHAVAGTFVLERLLAKHAILVDDGKKPTVYGALGLLSPLDEMFPREALPIMLKAVLLPFKGRVVLDGLYSLYNVRLGRGYAADYREIYLRAKQNGRIIERLAGDPWKVPGETSGTAALPGVATASAGRPPVRKGGRPKKEHPDPAAILSAIEPELERLIPNPAGSPAQKAAFELLKHGALLAKCATVGHDLPGALAKEWDAYNLVLKELRKVWRILKRASEEE